MQGENGALQRKQDLEAQRLHVLAELRKVDQEQQAVPTGQAALDEEAAQLEAAIKQLAKAEVNQLAIREFIRRRDPILYDLG